MFNMFLALAHANSDVDNVSNQQVSSLQHETGSGYRKHLWWIDGHGGDSGETQSLCKIIICD